MAASRNPVSSAPAKPGHPVAPMAAIGDHHRDFTGRDHDGPCASGGDNRGTFRDGAFIRIARRRTRRALPGRGQARRAARFPRLLSQRQEVGARRVFAPGRRHAMYDHDRAGTSVVDPYTRHAALLAQAAATLAELAPGRFRVIMGSGGHLRRCPVTAPQAGRRPARSGRPDAAAVARRDCHDRRRGGAVSRTVRSTGSRPRCRSSISPAAGRRSSSSPASRRRRADRQLRDPDRDRLRQGTHPAGLEASERSWKDIRLWAWLYVSCSTARTIRFRRASAAASASRSGAAARC